MARFPQGTGRLRPTAALSGAKVAAQRVTTAARSRTSDGLEWSLDRIFAEPFDVPDAATALRLLSGAESPPMSAVGRYLEGQAMVRIASQVTKVATRSKAAGVAARAVAAAPTAMAESGAAGAATAATTAGTAAMSTATSMGAAALAGAAVAAASRTTRSVRRGLNDLRVLASYLASRARAEGIALDKSMLRALTLAVYTDPRRRADFRFAGSRGAAAVLSRWSRDAAARPSESRRREDADAWVGTIDRLDLPALADEWRRRG